MHPIDRTNRRELFRALAGGALVAADLYGESTEAALKRYNVSCADIKPSDVYEIAKCMKKLDANIGPLGQYGLEFRRMRPDPEFAEKHRYDGGIESRGYRLVSSVCKKSPHDIQLAPKKVMEDVMPNIYVFPRTVMMGALTAVSYKEGFGQFLDLLGENPLTPVEELHHPFAQEFARTLKSARRGIGKPRVLDPKVAESVYRAHPMIAFTTLGTLNVEKYRPAQRFEDRGLDDTGFETLMGTVASLFDFLKKQNMEGLRMRQAMTTVARR